MDETPSQLDADLDAAFGTLPGDGASDPAPTAPDDGSQSPDDADATADDGDETESADDDDESPADALDTDPAPLAADASPDPETPAADPEIERLKSEHAQMRTVFEEAARRAETARAEQARQQAEAQKFDEWKKRFNFIQEYVPPEQQDEAHRQLASEIRDTTRQEATQVIDHERQQADTIAARATSMYIAAESVLPPDLFQKWKEAAQYVGDLPSPDAMKQTFQREQQIRQAARDEMKTELERERNKRTAQKRQQRIASGVDTVSAGSAPVATTPKSGTDEALDRLFGIS